MSGDGPGPGAPGGGIRARLRGWRRPAAIVFRDPEHVAERLTLYATERLAEPSRDWARAVSRQHPDADRAAIAEQLRISSARVARVDGAISGTPFLFALVPGYVVYLWQEGRMVLRIAALYGRDPGSLRTGAEMLALRGVHPTVEDAERELREVREAPLPKRPAKRRPILTWVRSVYSLLVFGGFLSPPSKEPSGPWRRRLRTALGLTITGVVWAVTWIVPFTFMIVMAWGCETHARQLGRRALAFYGGEAATTQAAIAAAAKRHDRGHDRRELVRSALLFLSLAVPLGLIAFGVHARSSEGGPHWPVILGALLAVSLVIVSAVVAARR